MAVVLGCNNFEVIDLGVMVPAEQIVQVALQHHADFIALSGLITPSLDEMCHTAQALAEAGIDTPLFVGGATTSPLHTALKIAPLYNGPVFHVKDASINAVLSMQLMSSERDHVIAENARQQAELVKKYHAQKAAKNLLQQAAVVPAIDDVNKVRLHIDWDKESLPRPTFVGYRTLPHISIAEVRPYINWIYFYNLWRVRQGTEEAAHIQREAEALLDALQTRHYMQAQVGFIQPMAPTIALFCVVQWGEMI